MIVDGEVVRTLGRGEALGEFALLSGGLRTATVRARRDSSLLALGRREFDALLAGQPTFALALIRELARRQPRSAAPGARQHNAVLALVPLHEGLEPEVAELADGLARELATMGTLARLHPSEEPARRGARLDELEDLYDRVLLVAGSPEGEWTRFCLRQADQVLAVVEPETARPDAPTLPRLAGCELLALSTPGLDCWLDAVAPRACHLVGRQHRSRDVALLARRLGGHALGLVLSGGGARGLAHVGIIDTLRRAGLTVDRVGGTSMGAFVSGLVAAGTDVDEMLVIARRELVAGHPFSDYTWPRHALLRAHGARAMLNRVFGETLIQDLPCPMFCISVDLVGAEEVVHRRGPLAQAVGLSMRLPGILPPEWSGGHLHVDGGVLDNLPLGVMVEQGEGPVVGVDVMRPFPVSAAKQELPRLADTIGRSMVLASWREAKAHRQLADTVITPRLDGIGLKDFKRLDEIVDLGRQAAEEALPSVRAALSGSPCWAGTS
jgi:predicted acylesterase/phospholipase RssA